MKNKFKLLVITPVHHIDNLIKKIEKHFEVTYHENINQNKLAKIIKNYDCLFTNPNQTKVYLGSKVLKKAKNLKVIATASTGTNHIDTNYLLQNGINLISLTKEYKVINSIPSTAQLALTFTLMSIRNVINSNHFVKKNIWEYKSFIGNEFSYLNVLVIGFGRLGKIYANYCFNLGFNVYIYDPFIKKFPKKYNVIKRLDSNLKNIDIISIHIHSSNKNKDFISYKFLNKLKNNVSIINTSRGDIINEREMVKFLSKKNKSKYYTDVLKDEHMGVKQNILNKSSKKNKNIFITSHIGGMTQEGQFKAYNHTVNLMIKFFKNLKK